jgi:hypothetical protein
MECEEFELSFVAELYGELDEPARAGLREHEASCARCAERAALLRRGHEAASALPLEETSLELEERVFAAVTRAEKKPPVVLRALRGLAWAGSHAMRPQLAMAALFCLVVGSSLLLLRARPGSVGAVPVRVTERGTPAAAEPSPQQAPVSGEGAPGDGAIGRGRAESAAPRDDRDKASDAPPPPAAAAPAARATAEQEAESPSMALSNARAQRATAGCKGGVGLLEEVAKNHAGTPEGSAAKKEADACRSELGGEAKADGQRALAKAAAAPEKAVAAPKPAARPSQVDVGF